MNAPRRWALGACLALAGASVAACGSDDVAAACVPRSASPSVPIDATGSARQVADRVLDAVERGDTDALRAVMPSRTQQNEDSCGGWASNPPRITSYAVEGLQPERPGTNAAGPDYLRSVRVRMTYDLAPGEPSSYAATAANDSFLLALDQGRTWHLVEVGGMG